MKKYQFLIKTDKKKRKELKEHVFSQVRPALLGLDPAALKFTITDRDPPLIRIMPFSKGSAALISITTADPDPGKIASIIKHESFTLQGYRVDETAPVESARNWEPGSPSPGVVLLTCLAKNSALTYDEFKSEWFGKHTPMSLDIHPMAMYLRNVVEEVVIDGSYPFEGIVEERFNTVSELCNPAKMFGGFFEMIPNMVKVGRHVNHFMDLKKSETYFCTEYIIKG